MPNSFPWLGFRPTRDWNRQETQESQSKGQTERQVDKQQDKRTEANADAQTTQTQTDNCSTFTTPHGQTHSKNVRPVRRFAKKQNVKFQFQKRTKNEGFPGQCFDGQLGPSSWVSRLRPRFLVWWEMCIQVFSCVSQSTHVSHPRHTFNLCVKQVFCHLACLRRVPVPSCVSGCAYLVQKNTLFSQWFLLVSLWL